MAKKWSELREKMSLEQQARSAAKTEAMLLEVELAKLRQAREMTQVEVAEAMNTQQASISKLERREDMYLSTLREYIEALGGQLKLVASFPDGDIPIRSVNLTGK